MKFALILVFLFVASCAPQNRTQPKNLNDIITELSFDSLYPDAKEFKNEEDFKTLENSNFKPLFYDLKIQLIPESLHINANLKIKIEKLQPSETLTLNVGPQIQIKSIKAENTELQILDRNRYELTLKTDTIIKNTFELEIEYSISGRSDALSFIKNTKGDVVQVWSKHEPSYARQWLPSFDWPGFKTPKQFSINVPSGWRVLSNGKLMGIKSNTYTWLDNTPHATYLYSFIAGPMEVYNLDRNSFYSLWLPHGFKTNTEKTMLDMKNAVQTYSKLLGPYPFQKLAMGVAYDFAGAMEHSDAITFSHMYHHPEKGFEITTLNHEIAHQWFGDLVTCKTWNDLWLNEGFATYFETLMEEKDHLNFEYRMEGHRKRYLNFNQSKQSEGGTGPIYNVQTSATQKFNVLSYEKPAVVIHMLREQLGDKLFFGAIKYYLNKYKYQVVTTQDFINAINEYTKQDLTWFFNQWVLTKGHPQINYNWSWENEKLVLSYTQLREDITYKLPLELWIKLKDSEVIEKILIESKQGKIVLDLNQKPKAVVLDPAHKILAEIKTQKDLHEQHEILNSAHWLSQADALKSIAKDLTHQELLSLLKIKNNFIKAEVLSAIAKANLTKEQLSNLVIEYLKSDSPQLRIAAANIASTADLKIVEDVLINTYLNDTSSYAQAFAATSLTKLKSQKVIPVFIEEVYKFPKRDWKVLIPAISALAEMGISTANDRIMEIFKNELTPARFYKLSVAAALAKLKEFRATQLIIAELKKETNPDMSLGYIKALEVMQDAQSKPYLEELLKDKTQTKKLRQAAFETLKKFN
ncbi:MAG: hypothetical protein IPM57_06335 [Oligoflexia bacterium]|nr:hypothetical protein [Oligoflexia bacterium]